ncbi:MAG: hypothetical protein U0892_09720 [Pirellulales bacterium]
MMQRIRNLRVQIVGCVCEGREEEYLAVARIEWESDLVGDVRFHMLQLGIICRSDLFHFCKQPIDHAEIGIEIMLPRRQIHVCQIDLNLAADLGISGSAKSSSSGSVSLNASVKSSTAPLLPVF